MIFPFNDLIVWWDASTPMCSPAAMPGSRWITEWRWKVSFPDPFVTRKTRKKYRICQNKRPPRNKRPPKTVIFQREGEYIKPMGFDGWFFKGGSTQNRRVLVGDFSKGGVHKTDGFWWVLECFLLLLKIKRPGRLFRKIRYLQFFIWKVLFIYLFFIFKLKIFTIFFFCEKLILWK